MKPDTLTVFEIFDKQKRYVVPLFQRPYVWSKEDQWEPLWQDIIDQASTVLRQDRTAFPHFLGAVVLNQIKTYGKEIGASEIIDGQQRLTTLQLFLAAFRDQKDMEPSSHAALGDLTENRHHRAQPEARFKLWPTNADRTVFASILGAGSREALEKAYPAREGRRKLKRPPLVECYLFFHDAIARFIRGEGLSLTSDNSTSPSVRTDALYEAIKDRLPLVVLELDEKKDDPQIIFETLNARGVPLLPSDLVRNFIFLQATREEENTQDLYDSLWRDYDERPADSSKDGSEKFWKQDVKQGRLNRARLDLFLHHYLSYKTETEINISRLYLEFRRWWGKVGSTSARAELKELRRHSDVFADLMVPARDTSIGLFAHRLMKMDTGTLYPLLLFLLVERSESLPKPELEGILRDLESYLVRRMVCGLTTKNYNHFFLSLLGRIRTIPQLTRNSIQDELLTGSGESVRWPSNTEFELGWTVQPLYQILKPAQKVAMLLEALDLEATTSKQERIHIAGPVTVEHVMPVAWREKWEPTRPAKDKGEMDSDEFRDLMIHSIGNLTLLTQPLNSSVSNDTFENKRPEIAKQSALRLNVHFQDATLKWDELRMVARAKSLLRDAMKIWPYPEDGDARRKLLNSSVVTIQTSVEVDKTYTRNDLYEILKVPADRRRGDWETGYHRYNEEWFIFATVGVPNRTGTEHNNYWLGDDLHWRGKSDSKLSQPAIKSMIAPEAKVRIFTRTGDREPFIYKGYARAIETQDTAPVTVIWSFGEQG